MEQEVPARYVDLHSECHYLVDFDVSEVHADGMLVHGRSDDPDARMQVSQQPHNETHCVEYICNICFFFVLFVSVYMVFVFCSYVVPCSSFTN